jgi:hypothetical protein
MATGSALTTEIVSGVVPPLKTEIINQSSFIKLTKKPWLIEIGGPIVLVSGLATTLRVAAAGDAAGKLELTTKGLLIWFPIAVAFTEIWKKHDPPAVAMAQPATEKDVAVVDVLVPVAYQSNQNQNANTENIHTWCTRCRYSGHRCNTTWQIVRERNPSHNYHRKRFSKNSRREKNAPCPVAACMVTLIVVT